MSTGDRATFALGVGAIVATLLVGTSQTGGRFDDVNSRIDDVNSRIDDVNTNFGREIAGLRDEVNALRSELRGEITGLRGEIQTLRQLLIAAFMDGRVPPTSDPQREGDVGEQREPGG